MLRPSLGRIANYQTGLDHGVDRACDTACWRHPGYVDGHVG